MGKGIATARCSPALALTALLSCADGAKPGEPPPPSTPEPTAPSAPSGRPGLRVAPPITPFTGRGPARFVRREGRASAYFTDRGLALALAGRGDEAGWGLHWGLRDAPPVEPRLEGQTTPVHLIRGSGGGAGSVTVSGGSRLRYRGVKRGVDLVLDARPGGVKYTLELAAGVEPNEIELRYRGATRVEVERGGQSLRVVTGPGVLRESSLRCFQREADGSLRELSARYAGASEIDAGTWAYSIEVDGVDPRRPLVVDPMIEWSTLLGGSGGIEVGTAITSFSGGGIVVGATSSASFPVRGGSALAGGEFHDVFVSRFDGAGALLWSTVFGGSGDDVARAVTTDAGGRVYLTGYTNSPDFPLVSALFGAPGGQEDGFVARLSSDGATLEWSTLLPGAGVDQGTGIELTPSGSVAVAGSTGSDDFPSTASVGPVGGAGNKDVFVGELAADGSALDSLLRIGGSGADRARGVTADASGVYAVGRTSSSDFPATAGLDGTLGGQEDAFALKASAGALLWATYLGGSDVDRAAGVAGDGSSIAIIGGTTSSDFPNE